MGLPIPPVEVTADGDFTWRNDIVGRKPTSGAPGAALPTAGAAVGVPLPTTQRSVGLSAAAVLYRASINRVKSDKKEGLP